MATISSNHRNHDLSNQDLGVTMCGMSVEGVQAPRGLCLGFKVGLLPRTTNDALAANSLCYVLHPVHGNIVVA